MVTDFRWLRTKYSMDRSVDKKIFFFLFRFISILFSLWWSSVEGVGSQRNGRWKGYLPQLERSCLNIWYVAFQPQSDGGQFVLHGICRVPLLVLLYQSTNPVPLQHQ